MCVCVCVTQLDNPAVASIVAVLEQAKSSYLAPFLDLRNIINRCVCVCARVCLCVCAIARASVSESSCSVAFAICCLHQICGLCVERTKVAHACMYTFVFLCVRVCVFVCVFVSQGGCCR